MIQTFSGSGVLTALPVTPALIFRSRQIAVDSVGRVYGQDALLSRILILTPAGAATPSSVSVDAVTKAASNLPLPIAPGEIVKLSGSGLGPAEFTTARRSFYETQLAGTSVAFNGIPAPIRYTSATRVAAVVPHTVTGGSARLTVTYQGQITPPPTVAQTAAINEDGSINSALRPAPTGTVISAFRHGRRSSFAARIGR